MCERVLVLELYAHDPKVMCFPDGVSCKFNKFEIIDSYHYPADPVLKCLEYIGLKINTYCLRKTVRAIVLDLFVRVLRGINSIPVI